MNELIKIDDNKNYTLTTDAGRQNIMKFVQLYNNQESNDPLFKQIGIDEGLAMTNINEFVKKKAQVAEIVREALEIGYTCKNFYTNTIFTFTRNKLKKAGYNSIIRLQIENYIKLRLHLTDKETNSNIDDLKYKNITSFSFNNSKCYYNISTGEELEGEELKKYLKYTEKKV